MSAAAEKDVGGMSGSGWIDARGRNRGGVEILAAFGVKRQRGS